MKGIKDINKEKGITLIALVITIIVLLILAGVTIQTLTGDNGLLSKSKSAVDKNSEGEIEEKFKLIINEAKMKQLLNEGNGEEILRSILISQDNNAALNKINDIYEATYMGKSFLLGNNLEYIKKENANIDEWTFDEETQTLTAYKGNLENKRENQEIGELIIPNYYNGVKIRNIGNEIFKNNDKLTNVNISVGIENIGNSAFYGCRELLKVIIPNTVTNMGSMTFDRCYKLKKANIPNGITRLSYTFYQCYSLEDITIPDSVTNIGEQTFLSCKALKSVAIPDSVNEIGNQAFWGCSDLKSVKIGKNLNPVLVNTFANSGVLKYDFTSYEIVPVLSDYNNFGNISQDCKIVVPDNLYDNWISATNWSEYASYIVKESNYIN